MAFAIKHLSLANRIVFKRWGFAERTANDCDARDLEVTPAASAEILIALLPLQVSAVFSQAEFDNRLKKLRQHMVEERIDAVVLTSYHNINYYTGFLFCHFGRKYGAVVTHDQCVTVSAGIDGGQPWRRSACDNVTYTDWQKKNYYRAVQHILGPSVGKLGLEFDYVAAEVKHNFHDLYPIAEIVDVGYPLMNHRLIKSEEEQQLIRNGAQIADIGGAALVEGLEEGMPEYEVAMISTDAMIREIARRFPDIELMDSECAAILLFSLKI